MTTLLEDTRADEFAELFRAEHRLVRDALLDLVGALEERDTVRARELLATIAMLTGPHFRYEEDALYPALAPLFGAEYVEHLLRDHDRAITGAARLVELASNEHPDDADVAEAVLIARAILPHVSDCDGLSIMVEVLPPGTVPAILEARERALAEALDLLTWAKTVRGRRL